MYKIIKCINCKIFQVSTSNTTFKCCNCKKSFNINKQKIFFESIKFIEVQDILNQIKEEVAKNKNQIDNDFRDASL